MKEYTHRNAIHATVRPFITEVDMKTIWSLLALTVTLNSGILCHSAWAVEGIKVPPVADVTVTNAATLVKAASEIRTVLNCTNTHATVHVRWGNSTVTAALGQQLRAGSSIAIANSAAIYMISEGADVTVSCTEETR